MVERIITPDFTPPVEDSAAYGRTLDPSIPMPFARDYSPDILAILGRILTVLDAQYTDRSRPATIQLGPGIVFTTHVRFKLNTVVIIGLTPADFFALKIGTSLGEGGPIAAGIPLVLPVQRWVDRGQDVSIVDITTPAASNWTAYILASEAD